MERSLGLAIVTLQEKSSSAALRLGSVLQASQSDRWLSVVASKENLTSSPKYHLEECTFQGNLTCQHNSSQAGWPIIVKKASGISSRRTTAFIVGLWNGTRVLMIDKAASQWVAKTIAQSLKVQYLPSCRGPGMYDSARFYAQCSGPNDHFGAHKKSEYFLAQK